jgi:hypothetical protein
MAILGQVFTPFPVFFEIRPNCSRMGLAIFPDSGGRVRIFILHFTPVVGIKRRARLTQSAHDFSFVSPLPAGLSSVTFGFGLSLTPKGWRGGDTT